MSKQRNRGQDGAGIAVVKINMPAGEPYLQRIRTEDATLEHLFSSTLDDISLNAQELNALDETTLKTTFKFIGDAYLGHLRYGTQTGINVDFCQPFVQRNVCAAKSFALAGNFNLTNCTELLGYLTQRGLNPTRTLDTQMIVDMLSHYVNQYDDTYSPEQILPSILQQASHHWDGGYVLAGIFGNGDAFIYRDPAGIRPGFFYSDEEVIAAASERAALISSFDAQPEDIHEIKPGHVLIINHITKEVTQKQCVSQQPLRQCVFERIYFSRSNDPAIYQERKNLGKNVARRVLDIVGNSLEHTVFTYIPNTGEIALLGLIEEIEHILIEQGKQHLIPLIRKEKIAHKDQLMRTFIANDTLRSNLVTHIYDVTKDIVTLQDTLVVIDDSVVRGTTLRESIIRQLISLNPAHIIFISSAPPILYPDCYGIDMSQLGRFIGFQSAVALLKEQHQEAVLDWVAQQYEHDTSSTTNYVEMIYNKFTLQELETKIAQMLTPHDMNWSGTVTIIYQTVDGLHQAIPNYTGDWYFTGNYPTPGGYKVLRTSYLNWYYGNNNSRAY